MRPQTADERRTATRVNVLYGALSRAWDAEDWTAINELNRQIEQAEAALRQAREEAAR